MAAIVRCVPLGGALISWGGNMRLAATAEFRVARHSRAPHAQLLDDLREVHSGLLEWNTIRQGKGE